MNKDDRYAYFAIFITAIVGIRIVETYFTENHGIYIGQLSAFLFALGWWTVNVTVTLPLGKHIISQFRRR